MWNGAKFIGVATGAIMAAAVMAVVVTAVPEGFAQTADRKTVTTQYGGWKVTCDEAGESTVCSGAFRVTWR